MSGNLRDRILNTDDTRSKVVPIPEWDGVKVEVRSMSASQRTSHMNKVQDGSIDFSAHYPRIIIDCTYDPESGERLFDEADRDTLMSKNGSAIQRIVDAITGLSQLDESEAEATFRQPSVE